MNPKLLILLLIIVLVFVWRFVYAPVFEKIHASRQQVAMQEKILESKQAEIANLKAMAEQLKNLTKEKESLKIALPQDPSIEELMVEFEALVLKSGMSLTKIDITPLREHITSNDQNKEIKQEINAKQVSVNINSSGTYDALKRFLALSQKDLRLMDIQKINFSSRASKQEIIGAPVYDFTIDVLTYYY